MGGVDARRVDHLVEHDRPGVEVQPDQVVGVVVGDLLGRHHEELGAGQVDDRGGGDAHRGVDVAAEAGEGGRVEGGPHVDRPQHRPGVGGQGVDGVVLGRLEHPPGGHQGLAVERPVQGG
jgi:hypothetical protein